MSDEPSTRITYRQGLAHAVNRRFLGIFWIFALTFVAGAFYRPAINAFSVAVPILVLLWVRALRKAPRPGWVLEISPERLVLEGRRRREIPRSEVAGVRIVQKRSGSGGRTDLRVVDASRKVALETAIDEPDTQRIARALEESGWPLLD